MFLVARNLDQETTMSTTTNITNNLGTIIARGTVAAAGLLIDVRKLNRADMDLDALMTLLREEAKNALTEFLDGGQAKLDANLGEAWLRHALNVECNLAAHRALDRLAA